MVTFKIDPKKHFIVAEGMYTRVLPSRELLHQPLSERKRWADALRSGRYKQVKELLYCSVGGGHCCLGVWESINGVSDADMEGADIPTVLDDYHTLGHILPENLSFEYIPPDCEEQVDELVDITCLNDGAEATFNQIAALIHPEGVTDWKALQ